MPDFREQLDRHEGYIDLPILSYSVWWRDDEGIKSSGRMPDHDVDLVVRHLNESYYPVTFWRTPVYGWRHLIDAAADI